MLTLWGRVNSINVQKALWCIEELGLPYRRVDAGGPFGIVNDPEYRRLNPNGLVPMIEDDGFVLWESNAIVRYLAAKHAPNAVWPEDLRTRADADRWMEWQAQTFAPAFNTIFHGLVRSPGSRPRQEIDEATAKSEQMAAILDAHLAGRAYVAGERFSVGDIATGCAAHRWFNLPVERETRPHMRRWYEALLERPAAAKVLITPLT